jgi:hypothetical protein
MLVCCCLRPGGVEFYKVFLDLRCLWVQQWLRALSAYNRGDKVVSNDFRMRANLVIGFILVAMLGGCAQGAAAGALGGLMASLFGSLLCGPYFPICFAATAAATATATVGATALVGGVMGVSGQLPVSSTALSGDTDARLSLNMRSLRIVRGFGKKIAFSLVAVAQFDWNLDQQIPKHSSRT